MIKKIKNISVMIDNFFYKKFKSHKTTKSLENIKEAQEIFSYLNEIGNETKVRFVGGCVRKALCGEIIDDIDLATSLTPTEVKKILYEKGVRVIDTGISHGTVTAILKDKKFEITTLRKDISTDGRHANVEFTLNWSEDAERRDFTINAIYSDIEGRIFDPVHGTEDLKKGVVKFIGKAEERIQEDYLRILRYFRFFTHYSESNYETDVIKVIKQHINGLNLISKERIFDELKKILKLKNVHDLFKQDISKKIILNIFPQFKNYERLKILTNLESKTINMYDEELILALLIIDETNDNEYFCHKYKTSNAFNTRLANIKSNFENLKNKKFYSEENIKKLIYLSNKEDVLYLLLFSICLKNKNKINSIEHLVNFVKNYKVPVFPISGDDLKLIGYKTGNELGAKLKLLETKWIEDNFYINKKEVIKSLSKTK
jgi:tRNA nucleotidyltransferase/poly(A) polymerase